MVTHRVQTIVVAIAIMATLVGSGTLFALRTPVHEMWLSRAIASYEARDMRTAQAAFEEALVAHPDFLPALVGAARTKLALGQNLQAFDDYRKLHERTGDPRFLASAGYCLNHAAEHARAASEYTRAVAAGHNTGDVLNNLGFSYLSINSFQTARRHLDQALSVDRANRPALHNRAILELRQAMAADPRNPPVPPSSIKDIESAIRLAPGFGNMHYLAATLWCLSELDGRKDRMLQHAQRAIQLGVDAQRFKDLPQFESLLGKEHFDALVRSVPKQALVSDPPRFVDPDPTPEELRDF
jgi:tetratricopeptide (TPR) repeat protein